jgi:hypothetical protein
MLSVAAEKGMSRRSIFLLKGTSYLYDFPGSLARESEHVLGQLVKPSNDFERRSWMSQCSRCRKNATRSQICCAQHEQDILRQQTLLEYPQPSPPFVPENAFDVPDMPSQLPALYGSVECFKIFSLL